METPKFCMICYDTGKPESLYTNHFMTDIPGEDGVVVCPTLLSASVVCVNCDSKPIDADCTRVLNSRTCTFCSQVCLREYVYDYCPGDDDEDNKKNKDSRPKNKKNKKKKID